MAKNYTFAEAVAIINEGKDMEAIVDIGKRFPILMHNVSVVTTKAGDAFVELMSYLPEHLTANKVNTAMKAAVGDEAEDAGDNDEAPAEEAKKAAPKVKKSDAGETETGETTEGGWASMNSNALYQELKKRGLTKGRKFSKKADMIEALEQYEANGGAAPEAEAEADEAAETTEAGNAYEGKSAMELFKECKKRGIKAAPKKPAKFYIDLLLKDDAKNAEAEETESEDWDDEEEVVEEPKATKKAAAPKSEKKPAKKAEPKEESEDDDWDI